MNRASLDRESLDLVLWNSITRFSHTLNLRAILLSYLSHASKNTLKTFRCIYCTVLFIMNVLVKRSNEKQKQGGICERIESVLSKILMLTFLVSFKKLTLLFRYVGQWSKWCVHVSTSDPKFQKIAWIWDQGDVKYCHVSKGFWVTNTESAI